MSIKYFIFMIFFVISAGIHAQQSDSINKYALVIGNGNYTSFGSLQNAVNDANDMAAALQSLGFTVDKLIDANLEQMENAAERLRFRLGESRDTYGFFYYAGHGVQSNGINWLIPANANIQRENTLRERAVSIQSVLDDLNSAGNALNIIVLDACRDFPAAWSRSVNRGLAVVHPPTDSIIMYATAAGRTASDGEGRNGLFTTHLLKHLTTPGIEVNDVFRQTMSDVARASNNEQRPALYTDFAERAYLGMLPDQSAAEPASVVQTLPTPAVTPTPTPLPVVPKQTERSVVNTQFGFGASVGTALSAPWLVGTIYGNMYFLNSSLSFSSFLELGADFGMLSGDADIGYYSIYPFAHYSLLFPVAEIFNFYIGAGGGYLIAEYNFPEGKMPLNIFAFDVTAGLRFSGGFLISYTMRTDFSSISNTISVGYLYRFNQR